MFKQLAAAALLLTIIASTLRGVVIVCEYYANKPAFSRFCENKAKPALECNGKCQLAKKLQEDDTTPRSDFSALPRFETPSSRSFFAELEPPPPANATVFGFMQTDGEPADFATIIFHPPASV